MGDDLSGSLEGKALSNLRVVDLKLELEKRGLSKSGSKKELVKRLKQKLELEKLYEEASSVGDSEPKLHLDEATEQNEFVKQYLAEQQKIYARQKEVKRLLELREQQEKEDSDSGHQDSDVSESMSIAKSSCDSSTNAEEDDDGKSLTEEVEHLSQIQPDVEPVSTCQGSPPPPTTEDEEIQPSSNRRIEEPVSMETGTKPSVIAYSLADIQLPESPQKVQSKVSTESHTTEVTSVEEPLESGTLEEENTIQLQDPAPPENKAPTEIETNGREEASLPYKNEENLKENEAEASDQHYSKPSHKHQDESPMESGSDESSSESEEDNSAKVSKDKEAERCGVVEEKVDVQEKNKEDLKEVDTTKLEAAEGSIEVATIPEENPKRVEQAPYLKVSENSCDAVENVIEQEVSKSPEPMDVVTPKEREESSELKESIEEIKLEESNVLATNEDVEIADNERSRNDDGAETKVAAAPVLEPEDTRSSSEEGELPLSSSEVQKEKTTWKKDKDSLSSDSSSSRDSSPKRKSFSGKFGEAKQVTIKSSGNLYEMMKAIVNEPKPKSEKPSCSTTARKLKRPSQSSYSEPKETVAPPKKEEKPVKHTSKPERYISMDEGETRAKKVTSESKEIDSSKKRSADVNPSDAPPRKITYRKLNIPFKRSESKPDESKDGSSDKMQRWQNYKHALPKTAVSISTNSLKSLIPDLNVSCAQSLLEAEDEISSKPAVVEKLSPPEEVDSKFPSQPQARQTSPEKVPLARLRKPVSEVPLPDVEMQDSGKSNEPPTPLQEPTSKIIFIQNLVRPFTVLQLKEVLKQYGNLIDEDFWVDRIKSKCFATYENLEQAGKALNSLHNSRWPSSNPKILSVTFASADELDYHRKSADTPKAVPEALGPVERVAPYSAHAEPPRKDSREERLRDKPHKEQREEQVMYIREWDKDKLVQESPERDRLHSSRDKERRRSEERKRDWRASETKKKHDDATPAKLLDDLFQKTKSTPCIYWLPLTEEQVKQKEESRRQRRLEREKRNQQEEEEERRARRRPRDKDSRSRSRSPARRR